MIRRMNPGRLLSQSSIPPMLNLRDRPEPADEGSLAGIGYSVTDGVAVIAELRE